MTARLERAQGNWFFHHHRQTLLSFISLCLRSMNYWFSYQQKIEILESSTELLSSLFFLLLRRLLDFHFSFSPMDPVKRRVFAFVLWMLFDISPLTRRRRLSALGQIYQSPLFTFDALRVCNGNQRRWFDDSGRCCRRCYRRGWLDGRQTCGLCGRWDSGIEKEFIVSLL